MNMEEAVPARRTTAQPKLAIPDERKDLLIGDRVHAADNEKSLAVLNQLDDVISEQ